MRLQILRDERARAVAECGDLELELERVGCAAENNDISLQSSYDPGFPTEDGPDFEKNLWTSVINVREQRAGSIHLHLL